MQMHLLWTKESIFLVCSQQAQDSRNTTSYRWTAKMSWLLPGVGSVFACAGGTGHQSKHELDVLLMLLALIVAWNKTFLYRSLKWTCRVWVVYFVGFFFLWTYLVYHHFKLSVHEKLQRKYKSGEVGGRVVGWIFWYLQTWALETLSFFFSYLLLFEMEGNRAFTQKSFEGEAFNLILIKYSETLLMEASWICILLLVDIWGIIWASQ